LGDLAGQGVNAGLDGMAVDEDVADVFLHGGSIVVKWWSG
jgi:hypothetical protein